MRETDQVSFCAYVAIARWHQTHVLVGSHIPCISIKFMENQRPIVLGRPRHDVSNVSCKVAPTFVCYVHKAKTYCDVRAYRADTMTIQVSMPQVAILLF